MKENVTIIIITQGIILIRYIVYICGIILYSTHHHNALVLHLPRHTFTVVKAKHANAKIKTQ